MLFALLWTLVLLVGSNRKLLSGSMDTVSTVISLYIPFSIVIGWGIAQMRRKAWGYLSHPWRALSIGVLVSTLLMGLMPRLAPPGSEAQYVQPEDLVAAAWIKDNLPEGSRFAVNSLNFSYNPEYIIGSDAGYWLPLLTGRQTITLPMVYTLERLRQADRHRQLVEFHKLEGHLSTPTGVSTLRRLGLTHVYIGKRGGWINPEELKHSPDFILVFEFEGTYVFALANSAVTP